MLAALFATGLSCLSAPTLAAERQTLFQEIGISDADVQAKLEANFQQFFHGDPDSESVYYLAAEKDKDGKEMAYIHNVGDNTVITEGMSYGMMIAVQMNKQTEFDNLWRWAKYYMQQVDGQYKGYFSWLADRDGEIKMDNPAPDGEAYFVQALLAASGRWGDKGAINYRQDAQQLLDDMLNQEDDGDGLNMFDKTHKMIRFTTDRRWYNFTDPSYHLPAFTNEWARYSKTNKAFWKDVTLTSRAFWKKTVHPETGLSPCYANFDGSAREHYHGNNNYGGTFQHDAFRTVMNAAVDKVWNGVDPDFDWGTKLHAFFDNHNNSIYTLDGKDYFDKAGQQQGVYKSTGLSATNGVAAAISKAPNRLDYVQNLWNLRLPTGKWRYYDGMLYMLSMLTASGQMKPYGPDNPTGKFNTEK